MSKKNLVGKVFGRLTVLEDSGKRDKYHNVIWRCECSCKNHNIVEVVTGSLTGGKTKSCGCLHKEKAKQQGEKTKSNLMEVKARGAYVILTTLDTAEEEKEVDERMIVPDVGALFQPIITIIPFQLLSYQVAKALQLDIDHPRNLAKSVTVE